MDSNQREIPTEIEARIRRSAPRLPPDLRRRTLAACTTPAPAAPSPPARFARTPRTWNFTWKPNNRRMMMAVVGGLCVLQIVATSLMQPVNVEVGPDGRVTPVSQNMTDTIRLAFQTKTSSLATFFSNLSK